MFCHCALVRIGSEAKLLALKSDFFCLEFKSFCAERIGLIARTSVISSENKDLFLIDDCNEGIPKWWESLHTNLIPRIREKLD